MLSNPLAAADPRQRRAWVVAAETPAALGSAAVALLGSRADDRDDDAERLTAHLTHHAADARRGRLVVRPPDAGALFAAVPVPLGGGVTLLLCPDALGEADAGDAAEAVRQTVEAVLAGPSPPKLIQSLRPVEGDPLAATFGSLGFEPLADLLYLARRVHRSPREVALPPGLAALRYSPETHDRFARALELSYIGSRDCPRMNDLRGVEDVIAGHKTAGEFRPEWWQALVDPASAEPLGVLILASLPAGGGVELVYLGLSPAARGRGLGAVLLRRALAVAAASPGKAITLAVDAGNGPAIRLYERGNFRQVQSRRVMLRAGGDATSHNDNGDQNGVVS